MPKHGDLRKLVRTYIHDDKVIKRKEILQQYYKYDYGIFGGGSYGYWEDIETENRAIEVVDLEVFKKSEKEGYAIYD